MEPVLIVEDEPAIADLIEMTLSPHGYPCRKVQSAEEAADLLDENRFSLVLLDVMLPGADGFALMDYMGETETPVIFVTARTDVADRVRGLRAGAYDYISKPFAPEELLARVDGLMRHTGRLGPGLSVWGVEIDRARRTVTRNGEPVRLTPREFNLMMMLVRNRGIALYRDVLLGEIWGARQKILCKRYSTKPRISRYQCAYLGLIPLGHRFPGRLGRYARRRA